MLKIIFDRYELEQLLEKELETLSITGLNLEFFIEEFANFITQKEIQSITKSKLNLNEKLLHTYCEISGHNLYEQYEVFRYDYLFEKLHFDSLIMEVIEIIFYRLIKLILHLDENLEGKWSLNFINNSLFILEKQ